MYISLDSLTSGAFNCFQFLRFRFRSRSFVPKIRHSEVVLTLSSRVCVGGSRTRARGVRASERFVVQTLSLIAGEIIRRKREIFR